MRTPSILIAALLALPLLQCDGLFDLLDEPVGCPPAPAEVQLGGGWTISGDGTQDDCGDELDNTSIEFRTERDLAILQDPTDGSLRLLSPGNLGPFTFEGSVQGSCVQFVTTEGGGADLVLEFTGTAEDASSDAPLKTVGGKFASRGPGSCVGSGTFKVEVWP